MTTNYQYKDRLFKFIFGNEEHKEWTLSLYNALTGSSWTDPEEVKFNTIEDAVYMGMRNDVSFVLAFVMTRRALYIWEHQSTFNPNIAIRIFLYAAQLYEKFLAYEETYRYGNKLIGLPKPKCVCFYNGTEEMPEEMMLKLSDSFTKEGCEPDIEVKVRMLNINYSKNKQLMEQCSSLNEYAWFVDRVRTMQKIYRNLEAAVDSAIDAMPDDFLLKKFLVGHRAEVKGMFITEWNEEKADYYRRLEAREEGISEAMTSVAYEMLKDNYPLSAIMKISKLSEQSILGLAESLGVAVVV